MGSESEDRHIAYAEGYVPKKEDETFECKNCGSTEWVERTRTYVSFDSRRKRITAKGVLGDGLVCTDCNQPPLPWMYSDLRDQFDRCALLEKKEGSESGL